MVEIQPRHCAAGEVKAYLKAVKQGPLSRLSEAGRLRKVGCRRGYGAPFIQVGRFAAFSTRASSTI
jgi:hypothetical protein